MVCVVWADKTGVSRGVSDNDVLDYLSDLNAIDPHWEVEEHVAIRKRLFRKPVVEKEYTLYYKVGSEWQVIMCASGDKKTVCAYMIGRVGGLNDK